MGQTIEDDGAHAWGQPQPGECEPRWQARAVSHRPTPKGCVFDGSASLRWWALRVPAPCHGTDAFPTPTLNPRCSFSEAISTPPKAPVLLTSVEVVTTLKQGLDSPA